METLIQRFLRHPVLYLFSTVMILLWLIAFSLQLGYFFQVVAWFFEMLGWYLYNGSFFANLGAVFGNGFYLLNYFFFTVQLLAAPVLVVLMLLLALRHRTLRRGYIVAFSVVTVLASGWLSPIYELCNAEVVFGDLTAFLYRGHGLLPTNAAALVIALFLGISYIKKKRYAFSTVVAVVAALQILLTLCEIVGAFLYGGVTVAEVLGWLIGLLSPVLWFWLGCLIEGRLRKEYGRLGGKLIRPLEQLETRAIALGREKLPAHNAPEEIKR